MTQNENGTDTPAEATVSPQVDTPAPEATADTITDSPETTELSEVDEILNDLGRTQEVDDAKGENDPDEDKWPDPAKDPKGYRDEFLKRSNALAEREKAIAERESAIGTKTALEIAAETPAAPAQAPATTPETASEAPKGLADTWQEIKAQMADAWENQDNGDGLPKGYEAAGERKFVEFMDKTVLPEMARMSEFIERAQAREVEQLGQRIAQTGVEASQHIATAYGSDVTPQDVLGALQNGGLQAFATLNGMRPDQIDLTKEVMVEIYELKHRAKLGEKKPAATEAKQTLPDLNRGDGARTRVEPQTEQEEILADLRAAQAVAVSR